MPKKIVLRVFKSTDKTKTEVKARVVIRVLLRELATVLAKLIIEAFYAVMTVAMIKMGAEVELEAVAQGNSKDSVEQWTVL